MRRAVLGIGLLAAAGCGTVVYHHTVEVTARQGAGATTRVAVFDRQSGSSRDWAHDRLGDSSAGRPYSGSISTTPAVTLFDAKRARPVTVSLAIPEVTDEGYFQLDVDAPARAAPRAAAFCGYGAYFPDPGAPTIPVTVSAEADGGRWTIRLDVDVRAAKEQLGGEGSAAGP
jgi:hypothetical protein